MKQDSKMYMMFIFILNPSFVDAAFRFEHLKDWECGGGGLFIQTDGTMTGVIMVYQWIQNCEM